MQVIETYFSLSFCTYIKKNFCWCTQWLWWWLYIWTCNKCNL